MRNIQRKIIKTWILSACVMASIGLAGCIDNEAKAKEKIDALKKQCDQLTQESNGERVYEAVVGGLVLKKTYVAVEDSRGGMSFISRITFKMNESEDTEIVR